MKTLKLIITGLIMVSCSTKPELSCDPIVNMWAKENIAKYENASRETIIELPISRQRAIYNGLSSQKKVDLWKSKQLLVKESNCLSETEYNDYSILFDYLKPEHYDSMDRRKELIEFANRWSMLMRSKHGWDDEKIIVYSHIWMTLEEFTIAVLSDRNFETKSITPGFDQIKNCECIYSAYCQLSAGGKICSESNCNRVEGCGILGTSTCDGVCI